MKQTQSPEQKLVFMRDKRDAKVHDHLSQYAPVWLINEQPILHEDAIQFEILFLHPSYGWTRRRYRFDSYNDVLYHKGQMTVDEADTYDIQAQDPYLGADVLNTVNSYGG
jgi:hypothetical protein